MAQERAPLPDACFLGDTARVISLIEEGYGVDEPDEFGWFPLHRAVESGNVDVLKILIGCGADPDALTPAESTAFHIAALHGYTDMAIVLIEADETPNVNEVNVNKLTPVMGAAFNCNPLMVRILLEQGAQVNQCDEDGWNPLHFAAWNASTPGAAEVAELLLEAGANVEERVSRTHAEESHLLDRRGTTALEIAKKRMALMTDPEKELARQLLSVLKKWEDGIADREAKIAAEKAKKVQYDAALDNAKRRTSLAGRRKSLEVVAASEMPKIEQRASKANQ